MISICIMAYIISFDVWCAIYELTPDTSILSRRWSFRIPFSYTDFLSDECSKNGAIFKYRTVHIQCILIIKTKEAVKFDEFFRHLLLTSKEKKLSWVKVLFTVYTIVSAS